MELVAAVSDRCAPHAFRLKPQIAANGYCQTINAFLVDAGTSPVPPPNTTTTTTTASETKTTTTKGAPAIPSGMTVEGCEAECTANSYMYAGVEYSNECWCGNTMQPTSAPSSDCNMPCKGNASEICGAGDRFNVYKSSS
ncbi:WSC domain-containing protein [Umbelopsis sp. AD052]|nr:WSC domain-containing protein [Umbelopsis sp. AD052]